MIGEHTSIWMTPSLLSHHALETVECDESNEGGTIFGPGGAGNYFTMSHTARRASSWPYMDFWTFKCFVTSVPGWGYDWWKHQYGWHPPFWVIMRSRRRHMMNHIATMGGPYLVVGDAGNYFTMIHTATRASSWPYMDFFFRWRQFRGVGYGRIWHMGGAYPYMGKPQRHGFLGCLKCPSIYYSQNLNIWFFSARTR